MKSNERRSASCGEEHPVGAEGVEGRGDRLPHGPPEDVSELSELDALWEDLVTTLPSLPNR